MRTIKKIFKTLAGVQKRTAFERAHSKPDAFYERCDGGWQIHYGKRPLLQESLAKLQEALTKLHKQMED